MFRREFVAAALFVPAAASAQADTMAGEWIVVVEGDERYRSWRVERVGPNGLESYYGFAGTPGGAIQSSVSGRPGQRAVRILTQANTVIEAREVAPGRFAGTFAPARGNVRPVTITRDDPDRPVPGVIRAARNSRILVLYVGARDCAPCRQFELFYKPPFLATPEGRRVTWREVVTSTFRDNREAGAWPADLRFIRDAEGVVRPGTPSFVVAVDSQIAYSGMGTRRWESNVIPLVRRLVAEATRA